MTKCTPFENGGQIAICKAMQREVSALFNLDTALAGEAGCVSGFTRGVGAAAMVAGGLGYFLGCT